MRGFFESRAAGGVAAFAVLALAGCGSSTPPPAPATFNKDIAPIVFANCASCHRPGGAAPFSLLTYAEAAEQAEAIASETFKGHMPPWLPARGEFPIVGERRLRPDQIDAVQRWVKGGSVEGAAADRPTPPTFPDGWEHGTPDIVVSPERRYIVKAGSDDVYRNLVLRVPLTEGVFVRAVEFRTNGASIHHAVIVWTGRLDRAAVMARMGNPASTAWRSACATPTASSSDGRRGAGLSCRQKGWPGVLSADPISSSSCT